MVIGFVITVRPKRKRCRTTDVSSTATITNSSLSSPTSKSASDSSARSRAYEGSNEVLYTITGFARGPSPPADLWNIFTDIERIQKSANEAKKRADALEVCYKQLMTSGIFTYFLFGVFNVLLHYISILKMKLICCV